MKRARVVHVCTSSQFVHHLEPLLIGGRAAGLDVHLVCSEGTEMRRVAARHAIPVHPVAFSRRMAPLADLVALYRILSLLRRLEPDLVHTHNPKAGLLAVLASWLLDRPCVHQLHGLPLLSARRGMRAILHLTEKTTLGLAAVTLCVSPSLLDEVHRFNLAKPEKVRVLAGGSVSGVDAEFFQRSLDGARRRELRTALGISDELVVGFAGRFLAEKGLGELRSAWVRIRARYPDARLLLAGREDGDEGFDAGIFEVPGVVRLGYLEDLRSFYEAIDLFVLPTYREGLPSVLLEAAAMEVPVVATRVVGCVDVVLEGETGTLVEARDDGALARAMEELLSDPATRHRYGRRAREIVLERFHPEDVRAALDEVYAELGVIEIDGSGGARNV